MTCPRCGHDGTPLAPTWTLFIPIKTRSQNELRNPFTHKNDKKAWSKALVEAMAKAGVPQATGPRRIVLTRVYTGREQIRDFGNLVGGMKPIVDAMQPPRDHRITNGKQKGKVTTIPGAGLIVDDSPAFLDEIYGQEHSPCLSGLRIEISDIPLPEKVASVRPRTLFENTTEATTP